MTKEDKIRELVRDPSEDYYYSAFKKIDSGGGSTWNWGAFCGLFWLSYRKMYVMSLLYLLLSFIFLFLAMLGTSLCFGSIEWMITVDHTTCSFVIILHLLFPRVLLGIFGTRIYYGQVKRNIRKGYHLCAKYKPTSVWLMCFVFLSAPIVWIRDRVLLHNTLKSKSQFDNSLSEENIKAALAMKSEHYYMNEFRKIESGNIISLNWAAFFAPFWWFFYRKMYLYGSLLYGFLLCISAVLNLRVLCIDDIRLLFSGPVLLFEEVLLPSCSLWNMFFPVSLNILLSLGGANHLYYHHLTKKLKP